VTPVAVQVEVAGHAPLHEGATRVIAEAGVNHNNSVERAIEMARRAAEAGAWAVKFQLYKADRLSVRESPKYWTDEGGTRSQFESFRLADHLNYEDYEAVADACHDLGIAFFATPFDLEAVGALERMRVPIYKVASGDITHKQLIEAVAGTGKPVLLSTGAATLDEIRQAVEWSGLGPEHLVLLACTLTYPTPDDDAHFARLETFRAEFAPYLSGFSDHSLGTAGGWMTAALGGVCVEKHYTLDKTLPDIPDHRISVDPPELTELVAACERGAVLRGSGRIEVHESEVPARENARRSVVVERDLAAGQSIEPGDVAAKRPGTGIPAFALEEVVGRRAARPLPAGHMVAWEDLE
jgi:N-acetylneuraminate synthase